jgi:RNA polymerase II elongation factor ELL
VVPETISVVVVEMVLRFPEDGLRLESSAKAMAALPAQAFAITLSESVIGDMIECVQNGDGIRLSLGNNPVS